MFYSYMIMQHKKYIVFEWIHGSGKTTLAKLYAQRSQRDYFHMPEESDYFWATIRKLLTEKDIVWHWDVMWLVYAAFANRFHYTHDSDTKQYVLDRHSFVTWLVFQRDIEKEIREKIYWAWLRALRDHWIVVYVRVDRHVAYERMIERNKQIASQWWVRKDKSQDHFFTDFERLSELYETSMLWELEQWGIEYIVVDNNGEVEGALEKIKY